MTTANSTALLRAILDDPGDDDLRLIYADTLEEEGDMVRAEFIRLQMELHHEEPGYVLDWRGGSSIKVHDNSMNHKIRHTANLWRKIWHDNYQTEKLHSGLFASSAWRRGFMFDLDISWNDWDAFAARLLTRYPLETVHLTSWPPLGYVGKWVWNMRAVSLWPNPTDDKQVLWFDDNEYEQADWPRWTRNILRKMWPKTDVILPLGEYRLSSKALL